MMTTTTAAASRMLELLLVEVDELEEVVVEIEDEGELDELVDVGGRVVVTALDEEEVTLVTL